MTQAEDRRAAMIQAGLNLIQQSLSIFDRDLRLVVWNRRYQEMFDLPDTLAAAGVSFEETIRYLVRRGEYGPVEDVEAAVRIRVEAARAFMPHYMERRRANGRWISVEGAPLPQGGWVTVYTDITEVKLQEILLRSRSEELSGELVAHAERLSQANRSLAASNIALEEAKRELTEMEARIRLTTEMMPAHIAHVDRDLSYTYTNRRASAVIPGAQSDIIGMTGREALGEAVFAKIEPSLRQALEGSASVFEFTEDNSGHRIRSAFTPDRGADGRINGVYILSTDVTEETQARVALAQTRKREMAAQLTSGLAHDFANLLTIILGLQSRLERADLPRGARDLVASTVAAARRGGALLDRIASISGKRALRPVPVVLRSFLADLRAMAGPVLPDPITLDISLAGLEAPVLLDAGALQDSLLNLILNAKDAIGPGQAGRISLRVRNVAETWIEFTVTDTGPGFSPEALEHALDPFFTTKGGAGSGLGLSMVYDQTTLSGGVVQLANAPDGGARVVLRLPHRRVMDAPSPLLVLLVEDNDDIRETVRGMLRDLGHKVIEATSGAEALELADLPGIDLVLSDIRLPGVPDGVDLAMTLTGRERRTPRVVLMSSLPPRDPRRAASPVPVLTKPFDATTLEDFLAMVRP